MENTNLFNDQEVYKIVNFMTDYNDRNINSEYILDVYGIDVEHLNTREALDTFMNHLKETDGVDAKELWGANLYAVFCNHIDKKGWLTAEWASIIENKVPKFDSHYNDNPVFKETYSRMYNTDFEESPDGLLIRPVREEEILPPGSAPIHTHSLEYMEKHKQRKLKEA